MSYTVYSDPRIAHFVLQYRWDEEQKELLGGEKPWPDESDAPSSARGRIEKTLTDAGFRVSLVGNIASIAADLPPVWDMTEKFIQQYDLQAIPVVILHVDHPESAHGVPIHRASIFGATIDDPQIRGWRAPRLQSKVFIVGRLDVRHIAFDGTPGDVVATALGHVRKNRQRAKATALKVARAIHDWDNYRLVSLQREVDESCAREEATAPSENSETDSEDNELICQMFDHDNLLS